MPLAIPALALLCIALACIVLSFAYTHTLGAVLQKVAQVFIRATWDGPLGVHIGFAFLGHAIDSLDNSIRNALYAGIQGSEWAWHQTLHLTGAAWQDIGDTVHGLAADTHTALHYLRHVVLPFSIRLYTDPLGVTLGALEQAVHDLRRPVNTIVRGATKVIYHDVPHALTKAEEAAIAAQVVVPRAVTKVIEIPAVGIDYVGREAGALKARMDRLARTLTPAGILGLVAATTLGALSLGWLKCSNVAKAGRSLCGMDAGLLEALLADGLVIFGTLSLVEFAEVMLAAMEDLSRDVLGGWRETKHVTAHTFTGYTGKLG